MQALVQRLDTVLGDLRNVQSEPQFAQIQNNSVLLMLFESAQREANFWIEKVTPWVLHLDDDVLLPVVIYAEALVNVSRTEGRQQNESIPDAINRSKRDFESRLPRLIYRLLDIAGLTRISADDVLSQRGVILKEIEDAKGAMNAEFSTSIEGARIKIISQAKEAVEDLNKAKDAATKISVTSAEEQFDSAAQSLRWKVGMWSALTSLFLGGFICAIVHFLRHPPELVEDVVRAMSPAAKPIQTNVSVPLLIAASAYFTSVRLALLGVLGVGLAFSIRMMSAYIHMVEHNHHKLRVTKSIEAFVAAVRTPEQKDLVLGKLVESVTAFGDTGILSGKANEGTPVPTVLFDAITKNVGKTQ